ncbi:turripeptide OL11-like [Anopheles darlingi]|uniref:Kazal domain-containing peptide n=1 Tax=Anopheles darlingi TaxID=43151 RepID=B6DE58_ANODA|nr:turripeptide OL11-like [Anopheles darlingi]
MRVAIIIFAILAVVCALPAEKNAKCKQVCTADYTPVCGVPKDGKGSTITFGNSCVMEKVNCESNKDYIVKSQGECGDKSPVRLS